MKVRVLGCGTSTGVPVIGCSCAICKSSNPKNNRMRSSVLIEKSGTRIVVDTGPDFRQQMISAGVDNIDGVIYTHTHADHSHGFDDLRQFYFFNKTSINCYLAPEHAKDLRERFVYAFADTGYQGVTPQVKLHEVTSNRVNIGELNFQVFRLPHGNMETFGLLVDGFLYFTDFKAVPNTVIDFLRDKVKVAIVSAARKSTHHAHSSMDETIAFMQEIRTPKGFITHMSHEYDYDVDRTALPEGIDLAFDGMEIEI